MHFIARPFRQDGPAGHVGGGERYPVALARAMSRHAEVVLATAGPSRESSHIEIDPSLALETFRWMKRPDNPYDPIPLPSLRLLSKFDVVHLYGLNKASIVLATACRLVGVPCCVTPTGGGSRIGAEKLRTGHLFSGFASLSLFAERAYPWIFNSDKPKTLLYGGGDSLSPVSGIARDPRQILFLGRITPHKGVDVLVRALPQATKLVVCGRVHDESYLSHLRALDKRGQMQLISDADDPTVARLLAESAIIVLPSTSTDHLGNRIHEPELLGLVLLEGMSFGCAAVATDIGPTREIISQGRTGFLVADRDVQGLAAVLQILIEDPSLRARAAEDGRTAATTTFTWDKTALRALDLYSKLAG